MSLDTSRLRRGHRSWGSGEGHADGRATACRGSEAGATRFEPLKQRRVRVEEHYALWTEAFANDIRDILSRAASDDNAVLLKAALEGESSLSTNERYRL